MADDINDDEVDTDEEGGQPTGGRRWFNWKLLLPIALVVLLGGGAAAYFLVFAGSDETASTDAPQVAAEDEPEPEPEPISRDDPPIYLPLHPALTVNFSNPSSGGRYVQVIAEVMSRDKSALELVENNMPAVRNALIMLLSEQNASALRSAAGKQKLQAETLRTVQRVVAAENRGLARRLEAVYFTKFVIQ